MDYMKAERLSPRFLDVLVISEPLDLASSLAAGVVLRQTLQHLSELEHGENEVREGETEILRGYRAHQ